MAIPNEVSDLYDNYHLDNLYRVCRFCYKRLTSKALPRESLRQPPSQMICKRAQEYYQINFGSEIADLCKPKVLCSICRARLSNLETGKLTIKKWEKDRPNVEFLPTTVDNLCITRTTLGCNSENRCQVCQINASSLSNYIVKYKNQVPKPGRPLEQSPCKPMCSKCGRYMDNHSDKFCQSIMLHPQNSSKAGALFAERVEARGFTSSIAAKHIKNTLMQEDTAQFPISLNHPYDSNNKIVVSTVGYEGRDYVQKSLSVVAVRDIQRLGHLGLGKHAYWELGRILRKEGITFPTGGIKGAWDEKWSVFGNIFTPITLQICRESMSISPEPTPFGFCTDNEGLLNIVTHNQFNRICRLKLQIDGGKDFLKMSFNIISMKPGSLYFPTPNSVLTNFVIAMGKGPENYHNLKQLFTYPSISGLFKFDFPIQIACDFKVAALLVGIQQASSNFPCPFCLWRNGTLCTGIPAESRKREEMMEDLAKKQHNVVNEPIISWSESVMEKIALAPLHILLGLVNKLYSEARPSESSSSRRDRKLYKLHCAALYKYKVFRSEYWNGTLEGNSCSRLLDNLEDIQFPKISMKFVSALIALKHVKDMCLGNVRKLGWQKSIKNFREAWHETDLSWSLKSHILSDHYEEYFYRYESIADAGAAISSEQSGEMLHSRLQRVWDLRFKTRADNSLYPQRLVDCMVTYNYNLKWDRAVRSSAEELEKDIQEIDINNDSIELDEERVELHNWITDSENSDLSDSD